MGIADGAGVGLVRGLEDGVGIIGMVGMDGGILVDGEDAGEETAGFAKGLEMGFVVTGGGMGLVAKVGEGLEEMGLKVDVGEGLGFDLVEADEVFSESSTFSVVSPSIRQLALIHSASTSATISPHGVSVSKLKIDEISPSSVLKRSSFCNFVASLTCTASFDDVGPSCDVGSCCFSSCSCSSTERGVGPGVNVRLSFIISTLLEREARRGGPGSASSSASFSLPGQRTLPNNPFRPFRCRPGL